MSKIDAERAAFEAAYGPGPFKLTSDGARYLSAPVDQAFQGWMLRADKDPGASQPVGAPDGYALVPVEPTVKAEQGEALTGERLYGMWVAASGLGADPWHVVTHEHDGWNGLAARLDAAPSLPAAGSEAMREAFEQSVLAGVGGDGEILARDSDGQYHSAGVAEKWDTWREVWAAVNAYECEPTGAREVYDEKGTLRLRKGPADPVSVPRELLERVTRKFGMRPHWDSMKQGEAIAELRALLASHASN